MQVVLIQAAWCSTGLRSPIPRSSCRATCRTSRIEPPVVITLRGARY